MERLISKVATGKISPREVIYLKESLDAIIPIKSLALDSKQEAVRIIGDSLHACDLLREKLKQHLIKRHQLQLQKAMLLLVEFIQN